jgi:hypothetical protein
MWRREYRLYGGVLYKQEEFRKMNSDLYIADYNVNVTYDLGLQRIDAVMKIQSMIKASVLIMDFPI